MELFEEKLRAELQRAQISVDATSSEESKGILNESISKIEAQEDKEARRTRLTEKLEDKKKELVCYILMRYVFFCVCALLV